MTWLIAGYAAFFLLTGAYVGRLVLMHRRLRQETARLGAGKQTR